MDRKRSFSLVELVIVVIIIGMLSAMAIPRLTSASRNAELSVLQADLRVVRDAIEYYTIDHLGHRPEAKENGDVDGDAKHYVERLTGKTDIYGKRTADGEFGPYLKEIPPNRFISNESDQTKVRIDGKPPGEGSHGWHCDTTTGKFTPDSPDHGDL